MRGKRSSRAQTLNRIVVFLEDNPRVLLPGGPPESSLSGQRLPHRCPAPQRTNQISPAAADGEPLIGSAAEPRRKCGSPPPAADANKRVEQKSRGKRELADRGSKRHRKRLQDAIMAVAWCLRWGLSRARPWLLPPPTHCPRRDLHKQEDGTEFQSIYSLDKLYPESRGLDTAWKVPVSRKGRFFVFGG